MAKSKILLFGMTAGTMPSYAIIIIINLKILKNIDLHVIYPYVYIIPCCNITIISKVVQELNSLFNFLVVTTIRRIQT